ncbi:MAG: hypothetical protein L3J97_02180 [Thermoplasmata archaeon]|nr:hypothetical protein [Thermoplasmata archaeon]
MKDQYFGDVNDYRKYGLLRQLGGHGRLRTIVCWALTESDGRSDGARVGYLERPAEWRRFDPDLFNFLRRQVVHRDERRVEAIERASILPNCAFFGDMIPEEPGSRDEFLRRCLEFAKDADLLFFDPDNGLGVKSVPRGTRNSSKYVYLCEVREAFESGHSVLLYQHFPRRSRLEFIRSIVGEMAPALGVDRVASFVTSHVVFLLFPQPRHWRALEANARAVASAWSGEIEVRVHRRAGGRSPGDFPNALLPLAPGQEALAVATG